MSDLKRRIDDVAALMDEFGLESARLRGEDWCVELSRVPVGAAAAPVAPASAGPESPPTAPAAVPKPTAPRGTPVSSPMTGIFYSSPNPGAPTFVKEGDTVTVGQVVGLIEAMKVFNEITATVSGNVTKVCVESGKLVQPGDALLYIG